MLSAKMEERLNQQINAEFYSAYLYLSMSAYLKNEGFSGAAQWMRIQHDEEMMHALKIYDYVNDQEGRVNLMTIKEPPGNFTSLTDVFEKSLAHEQGVTQMINDVVGLAIDLNDHATNVFLQWFVTEQIEEESTLTDILQQLKLIGGDGPGLYMLDKELGARSSALSA